jgi:hypothetical protein
MASPLTMSGVARFAACNSLSVEEAVLCVQALDLNGRSRLAERYSPENRSLTDDEQMLADSAAMRLQLRARKSGDDFCDHPDGSARSYEWHEKRAQKGLGCSCHYLKRIPK